MQQTTIYRELEAMIKKGWLVKSPSELDQLLAQLEKARQITREEYRSLLELYVAKGKKLN
jgi:DNA-binding MarR family transcriptional regulator